MKSVAKAAEILKTMAAGLSRLSDIAHALNLQKSTTCRLLKALQQTGLVTRDPYTRRYYLGSVFLNLRSNLETVHGGLINLALEDMEKLRKLTGETICLHIRVGTERVCLEELPSTQVIKFVAGKGALAPLYAGASGKILLEPIGQQELNELFKAIHFSAIAPNTITEEEKLREELKRIRKQGFAESVSERVPGSAAVSALIRHYSVPVALSVIGPEVRIAGNKEGIITAVVRTAKEISRRLKEQSLDHREGERGGWVAVGY